MYTLIVYRMVILLILGVFLPIAIRGYKNKSLIISIIHGWGFLIIWSIIWGILVPVIASQELRMGEPNILIDELLVIPVIFFGWPSGILSHYTGVIFRMIIKFCQKPKTTPAVDTTNQPEELN